MRVDALAVAQLGVTTDNCGYGSRIGARFRSLVRDDGSLWGRPFARVQQACNRLRSLAGEYSTGTSRRSSIWPTIKPCSACVTRLISDHSVSAMKADHAAVLVASSGHSSKTENA